MLKTRIITAVTLVFPLILLLVCAPRPIPAIVGFIMYCVAAWEWSRLVPNVTQGGRILITVVYVAALAGVAVTLNLAQSGSADLAYSAVGVVMLLAIIWWSLATVCVFSFPFKPPAWFIVASGALVIVPAYLVVARAEPLQWWPDRMLLSAFLLVWAADIGAYFVGRAIGRHKLAPSVSPGKTWEGLGGGLALAWIVAAALAHFLNFDLIPWLMLATLVVLASVIGDLTVSLFKRHAGIKDMGRLFPGHGGVLDRFDSFSAAAPVLLALNSVFVAIPEL